MEITLQVCELSDSEEPLYHSPVGILVAFLSIGLALLLAAFFVGRAATRLKFDPAPPLIQLDEIYEWLVERLPDDVAATLTPKEAKRIMGWSVACLKSHGVVVNGSKHALSSETIVTDADIVDYVLLRAQEAGEHFIPEQIRPVVAIELQYLEAVGAISHEAVR